jgi:hypothetical protein
MVKLVYQCKKKKEDTYLGLSDRVGVVLNLARDVGLLGGLQLHTNISRRVRSVTNLDDNQGGLERRFLALNFLDFIV